MKLIIISLCLVISATQQSVAQSPNELPAVVYTGINIDVSELKIPDNSWWISAPMEQGDWAFDWKVLVEYNKDIYKRSPIWLDYDVQYDAGIVFKYWTYAYRNSVHLCYVNNFTEKGTIIAIVRDLIGIPNACPVSAGTRKIPKAVSFPLKQKILMFNKDLATNDIRIVTNMRSNATGSVETLFTGVFTVNYLPTSTRQINAPQRQLCIDHSRFYTHADGSRCVRNK